MSYSSVRGYVLGAVVGLAMSALEAGADPILALSVPSINQHRLDVKLQGTNDYNKTWNVEVSSSVGSGAMWHKLSTIAPGTNDCCKIVTQDKLDSLMPGLNPKRYFYRVRAP